MMKCLSELLVYLSLCTSLMKVTLGHEVSFDLEGGSQYEIVWETSRDELSVTTETKRDEPLAQLLPNMLLGEGQWPPEVVVVKTADNEDYTCLLPSSTTANENSEVATRSCIHLYDCTCIQFYLLTCIVILNHKTCFTGKKLK